MAWEPDSEEIRLRKQNDEIKKLRENQFFINTNIDVSDTTSNGGTVNGLSGFNFGAIGDFVQNTTNAIATSGPLIGFGVISIVGALIKVALDAVNEPTPNVATIKQLNGGGIAGAGIVGQKVTLKPPVGKSLLLVDNPTSNASSLGNLILGGSNITITDTELITLRFQDDVTFTDGVGGWIVDSTGGSGGSTSTSNSIKQQVRVATTGNNVAHPVWSSTIDGVVVVEGDRILIKDQTTGADNGIYTMGAITLGTGTVTRATDFDEDSEVVAGVINMVSEGTVNADTLWILTTDNPIVVGTTTLSFTQFTGGGADNLGNHTATQALRMKDFAIFLDVAELHSIISLGNAINYVNDISIGGSHDFYVDDLVTPKFGITETSIESNVTLDMNGKNIISSVNPATDEFRIVFDGHDDSDTFISNSTTADRIAFVSNGTTVIQIDPTELLFNSVFNLNMNTSNITTVGNIDFGTGSPASGRIRLPNTSGTIKWESVPSGDEGELYFDADEKFFWRTTSTGEFGFWHGISNTLNVTSSGIDMLFNTISNARYGTDMDARNFNLTSTSTPTAGSQFRIVFDGHDDSDTYLSNSTTADRISIVSNGVAVLEISPTELLVESTYQINMNTADITTVGNIDFGAGSPASGRIRIPNTATIKWESVPSGSPASLEFDVDEKFVWSIPSATGEFGFWHNGFNTLNITASGIDMLSNKILNIGGGTISDLSTIPALDGTNDFLLIRDATDGTIKKVSASALSSGGSTSFIGFTADADLDMGGFDIQTTTNPSTHNFRIYFDAHDDSDTYFSNSTTADTITVVSNAISTVAFNPSGILMGTGDLDMNTRDIQTVGNIDFGTGSPASGRIRLPNTSGTIKWESSPSGSPAELYFDVDEKFVWSVPTGGEFGFWHNGFNTMNILSTGIDMLLNSIDNVRSIEVNSSTGTAGFRDVGFTADPTTPLAGEMYYNTTSNVMKFYNGSSWVTMSGGGSQTPWTSDIDGDGFSLTDFKALEFKANQTAPASSIDYMVKETVNLVSNVTAGDGHLWRIGGTQVFGLGTSTNNSYNKLDMNSNLIQNVTDPSSAQDVATKAYVDANNDLDGQQDWEVFYTHESVDYNFEVYMANSKTGGDDAISLVEDTLYYVPFFLGQRARLSRLGYSVNSATGTYFVDVGIYDNVGGGISYPNDLLREVAINTSGTGSKTGAVTALDLEAGLYWLAIVCTNQTITSIKAVNEGNANCVGYVDDGAGGMNPLIGFADTHASAGALPSTADADMAEVGTTVPLVFAKWLFNPN